MFKVGDLVEFTGFDPTDGSLIGTSFIGHQGHIIGYGVSQYATTKGRQTLMITGLSGEYLTERFKPVRTPIKKGQSLMLNDLRSYVKDNRQLLYTIALVVALDHFLFNGAFRERIKGLVESLLSSAEKKIG